MATSDKAISGNSYYKSHRVNVGIPRGSTAMSAGYVSTGIRTPKLEFGGQTFIKNYAPASGTYGYLEADVTRINGVKIASPSTNPVNIAIKAAQGSEINIAPGESHLFNTVDLSEIQAKSVSGLAILNVFGDLSQ